MTEYVPHIVKNGSREHVISYHGGLKGSWMQCNVKNCEVNKERDQRKVEKE